MQTLAARKKLGLDESDVYAVDGVLYICVEKAKDFI